MHSSCISRTRSTARSSCLERFGADGWAMAGGNDSLDWFKDRVKRPKYVVDLSGIGALNGIRETADGGIEIGALTTLTEIERSDVDPERYKVLADAAAQSREPADPKHAARSAATSARTRAAGTTATAWIVIAPAATRATRIRPKARTASIASGARTAASP